VNLFYMFNAIKKEPNYYRIFPGNINGTSALKLCLQESKAKNCIAIGDKGFCSEKNLNLLEDAKLRYILPLRRESKLINYTRLESRLYEKAFDGHFIYQDRAIFYTTLEEKEGKKIVIFTDKSLGLEEEKNYLKRITQNYEDYDMESYQKKQITFGTIAMISNCLDINPEQIYLNYKSRMEIETVFDSYKNLLEADRTYMHSDKAMEAWAFMNHIAIMMYYRIFSLLKSANIIKSLSPAEKIIAN
jgi:transposase